MSKTEQKKSANKFSPQSLPEHIAIIMDGNGRWAQKQGFKRVFGHETGVNTVRTITEECAELGVKQLTVYAFSTENWKRSKLEVSFLMRLLKKFLKKELKTFLNNNISLRYIGRTWMMPKDVQRVLEDTVEKTSHCDGLKLCLALSYGSRAEIVDAVKEIVAQGIDGKITPDDVTEEMISEHLYMKDMQDPDLIIRTAGEMRLSNFLLWQASYSEFYSTEVSWPEFTIEELHKAITEYGKRDRKYGGVKEK